jgi:hypothetical protein
MTRWWPVAAAVAAGAIGVGLGACGGGTAAVGGGQPGVRKNDYRLYEIPGGKTIVCIGWGSAGGGLDDATPSSAITCDWDHPLDR